MTSAGYSSVKLALEQNDGVIRLLEAHDRFSAEMIRNAVCDRGQCFQGVWVSGLTQTTHLGIPDTELISPLHRAILYASSRGATATHKRSICAAFDADSGGSTADIPALVSLLATIGISMVVIEDKALERPGAKVNSLLTATDLQPQQEPHKFANVIRLFKAAVLGKNMLITARIESFNVRIEQADAAENEASVRAALHDSLSRAETYTAAGADAIMIHSKSSSPAEVLAFSRGFRAKHPLTPLVVVPTTYARTLRSKLINAGANIVIYANHLMRAKINAARIASDTLLAVDPAIFANDTIARNCLAAENYGCLIKMLLQEDYRGEESEKIRMYLAMVQKHAIENMAAVIEELAMGDKSGCEANARIISLDKLLKINAIQLVSI